MYCVQEYEITPEGTKVTSLEQILLNGKNVCMMIPGGSPEDAESSSSEEDDDEDAAAAPALPAAGQ